MERLDIFGYGYVVCTATHPNQPNFSGNARGRKLHIASPDKCKGKRKLTLCGMLMDERRTESSIRLTVFDYESRQCSNCLKEVEKLKNNPQL